MIRPSHLYDRIIYKNQKGMKQFESAISKLILEMQEQSESQSRPEKAWEQYDAIINFFLSKARNYIHHEQHRALLIQSIEVIGFSLDQSRQITRYFKPITSTILTFFSDSSQKVKVAAIGAIYNIMSKYLEQGREFFIDIFERLSILIADQSGQIKQAATFLNKALKVMVYDAELDQTGLNLKTFVQILSERLQTGGVIAKQFMLDWLMSIQEVPQFEISFDLPLFFRQIFLLLEDSSKSLKSKAQECLKKFLHVFKQQLSAQGKISSKISQDSAQVLFEMILILIRENINADINLHAFEWFQVFTRFFSLQLAKQSESTLAPIYSALFKDIILVVITSLSDESDRMRKISSRINEALLLAFPSMNLNKKSIDKTSQLLEALLSQTRAPLRVEAILRWIKLFLHIKSQHFLLEIDRLIELIVEKLCDKSATRILFQLIQGSLFVETYYSKLVTTLLAYLFQNDKTSPEPIFRQLVSLKDSQNHYLILCKRVRCHQNKKFQYRLIQSLIGVLVSEHSLEQLRITLIGKDQSPLFTQLFLDFSNNQTATLILCFLAGKYYLAKQFIHLLALQERLSNKNFRSLIRMSNLIEHSNMNHLRSDLRKSSIAIKAYLSLMMALPYGKCSGLLLQRVPPKMPQLSEQKPSIQQQNLTEKLLKEYQNEHQDGVD